METLRMEGDDKAMRGGEGNEGNGIGILALRWVGAGREMGKLRAMQLAGASFHDGMVCL